MVTEAPRRTRCPVCEGAGWIDARTGHPVRSDPLPPDSVRCPFCEGTGIEPKRSGPI